MRASRLCLGVVAALTGCASISSAHRPTDDPAARVTALADEFVREYFEAFPLDATTFDVAAPRHDDRWTDNAPAALARWRAKEDQLLAQVADLDPALLVGRPEGITLGVLREQLETRVAERVCHEELWFTRSDVGLASALEYVSSAQPVGSPAAKENTLARWRDLGRFLDVEIANLTKGLALGYRGEKNNVRRVIAQMDALLTPPIDKTPLYDPARRANDPDFAGKLSGLIATDVRPAIKRYRDFLETTYLPGAREQVSVEATPGGPACYRAFLREGTSLPAITPDEIHRVGVEQMRKIEDEMKVVARRSFKTDDLVALFKQLNSDDAFAVTGDEYVRISRETVNRAQRATPRILGLLPKTNIEVRPNLVAGASAYQNSPGAGRPGIYWVGWGALDQRGAHFDCETIAFHETVPGHHLQYAIGAERAGLHSISRYFWNNAFAEGWALYAERLADELGLFSDDLNRLGMLALQALRAARLVVDTGLHALGWSRERAVDYMVLHTGSPRDFSEQEVDRYIGYPGQATGYMIGMIEIRRLRDEAEAKQGPRFDLKQFHDRVLEDGNVTLPMLGAKIERWLDAR